MTTATKSAPKAAATAADATDHKISAAVTTLSSLYAPSISVAKDGVVTIDGDIIHDNLPAEQSLASIKAHQKLRGEIVAALTDAAGPKAFQAMAKNKDLDRVVLSTKLGNDKIELAFERNREFGDGKGGKVVKHGYVNLGYTVSGATNAGDFKKVRAKLGDEAAKLFG